jgi:amino acid adenylation domain-containing protein
VTATAGFVYHAGRPDLPGAGTVHGRFLEQARQHPDRPALTFHDHDYSYGDLDAASRSVAALLTRAGAGPGTFVAIALPRSPRLIAGLLGVLRTGSAYLVLGDDQPAGRSAQIIAAGDVQISLGELPGVPECLPLAPWRELVRTGRELPGGTDAVDAAAPCAVFFTSGSTGTPKGILSPHRATVRLADPADWIEHGPGLTSLQASPLSWDGLTLELWPALMTGGRVVLADAATVMPDDLRRYVAAGVTTAWLTSSLLNALVTADVTAFRGLDRVLTGGEALSPGHIARLATALPTLKLINGYGPAENCTLTTTHEIRSDDLTGGPIPIGRPTARCGVAVVDENLVEVPAGELGEIVAYGQGLALGYLGDSALTVERFVEVAGRRVYRTGDLGRWDPAGRLTFHGRRDRQVKIRGYRIELAEVERRLRDLDGVHEVRVVVVDGSAGLRLRAFVVPAGTGVAPVLTRGALAELLPAYMIPESIQPVPRLPLRPNGKVDDDALRAATAPVRPDHAWNDGWTRR